jgi:hypothetical protein
MFTLVAAPKLEAGELEERYVSPVTGASVANSAGAVAPTTRTGRALKNDRMVMFVLLVWFLT